MTNLLVRLAALILLISLAGCSKSEQPGVPPTIKAQMEIRFAHSHAPDTNGELHFSATAFAEAVGNTSDKLTVRIYPQGTLGSEREVYEGLQLGSGASCTVSGSAILNNFDQRIGVLDMPYLWKDYDHVHRVLDGEVGRDLAAGLEKQGIVVLAWLDSWGYRNIVTRNKPVKRPEDLKGLKIRTIPTPVYLASLRMMGTDPSPMSWGETYTALQTGVIDGFEQASAILVAERFYEVTKHITLTRHLFGPLAMCYSKAHWDRLSPADQAVIRRAAEQARDQERARALERETAAMALLREKGMQIHEFDARAFEQAAIKLQDQIAKERGATDLLEKIRRAAKP